MKILITGAGGFIGKNLRAALLQNGYEEQSLYLYDIDTDPACLKQYTADCDFVFHLAGVNRPKDVSEYMAGNCGFTGELLEALKENNNRASVIVTSSIQAALNNPYGESKKAGEELLFRYAEETGASVTVYRLANVFGKWCRPHYNSVVATFCHQIARDLPIQINDPMTELKLVYIDDVVAALIGELKRGPEEKPPVRDYLSVPVSYSIRLGELAERIKSFRESRKNLFVPSFSDELTKKLYSTYLSYLPEDDFSYPLEEKRDDRGSFTEFLKTTGNGQVSVNVVRPGITKGNHWHHSKNEKFLVVKGKGLFRFRKWGETSVTEYHTDDQKLQVIDIPTGYVHNIINEGEEDLIVLIWANETFDPACPDTWYEEV